MSQTQPQRPQIDGKRERRYHICSQWNPTIRNHKMPSFVATFMKDMLIEVNQTQKEMYAVG